MLRRVAQKVWQTTRNTSRDSWHLGQAYVRHAWQQGRSSSARPTVNSQQQQQQQQQQQWKSVLLQEAPHNSVAVQMLLWDKQLGLLRYHGLPAYMQQTGWFQRWNARMQRLLPTGSSRSTTKMTTEPTTEPTTTTLDETTTPTVAKVAFMITSQMKAELVELGYEAWQVRSMTPMQASLVLQHHILPNDYESQLPALEQEAQQEQERLAMEALRQTREKQTQEEEEALRQQMAEATRTESKTKDESTTKQEGEENNASSIVLQQSASTPKSEASPAEEQVSADTTTRSTTETSRQEDATNTEDGEVWYELVDSKEEVVALYRTPTEAEEGRQIRQDLAKNNENKDTALEIRTSVR